MSETPEVVLERLERLAADAGERLAAAWDGQRFGRFGISKTTIENRSVVTVVDTGNCGDDTDEQLTFTPLELLGFCREVLRMDDDAQEEARKQRPLDGTCNLLAAAFALVAAARRVRAKFGTDEWGQPLDWTEWRDVDDACNTIDRIAADT